MILSTIGVAELLNALTEVLSWFGQAARDDAGLIEEGALPVAPPTAETSTGSRGLTRSRSPWARGGDRPRRSSAT